MSQVVLDSCTWIWLASDKAKLSYPATEAIETASSSRGLVVSIISCWEVAKLVEKQKLRFAIPVRQWIERALRLPGIRLEPLTPPICVESTELPGEFHLDPADQLIVATARSLGASLVTPDSKIRKYGHVATIW